MDAAFICRLTTLAAEIERAQGLERVGTAFTELSRRERELLAGLSKREQRSLAPCSSARPLLRFGQRSAPNSSCP
ncbi:hypothetical protein [Microtetraspora fusca]|uniref:hypothetical protein n=1 Tax=Microtetraspora fusca TaxID=1997 RepID=UPI000834E9BB|nr:hypothetical protein [Microtetraspora fusca]